MLTFDKDGKLAAGSLDVYGWLNGGHQNCISRIGVRTAVTVRRITGNS